jgi:hypothetical protein
VRRSENLSLFLRFRFPVLRRVVRWTTLGALLLVVGFVYLFLVTAGTFDEWPTYNALYDSLATGFRHGHLYLPIEPPPELVAAADPLDPVNTEHWFPDLSFYKGKYYIYWGPFPSLGIWAAKSVFRIRKTVGDQFPCFVFYLLFVVAGAMLLQRMARRLFPGLPHYLLLLAIAVHAFASPTPYLIATPGIYEAAIAGAQAFLLLGLVLAFDALGGVRKWTRLRLVLAGVAWSVALACRVSIGPTVLVFVLLTALVPQRSGHRWLMALRDLALMSTPIVITSAALLYYNKARFDSWLEFGTGVQLNTVHYRGSWDYIGPNLYSYLLRWPKISCEFPFTTASWDAGLSVFPPGYPLPEGYWIQEPVVGMLVAAPWVWLCPLGLFFMVIAVVRRNALRPLRETANGASLWCAAVFLALATVTAIPFIATFNATMRYLGDVTTGFVLFATWGGWALYRQLYRFPVLRFAAGTAFTALAACTIAVGLLFGFQGYGGHFKLYNAPLHDKMVAKYSRCR